REAIRNLQMYLFAAPRSPNASAIQARIYAMEVLAEEKEKVLGLAGSWRSAGGNTYNVTVDGNRIRIEGAAVYKTSGGDKQKYHFTHDLEKKGSVLEGSLTIARDGINGCYFPNETVPESGFLRADGKYLKVEWKETLYSWTWQGTVCTGVTSMGKSGTSLELVEKIAAQ
ncbi:MAG: hypothetical protein M0Z38_05700, partial [Deltaproteobacteria bacterium]|nr:hypothetical protein [Deltaproteobacteria bacterium]